MNNEKVKVIKEYLRCMRGEKACWDCGLNEIAENQDTCCINLVADMALDLINELESENERLSKDNELLRNAKVVYETVDYCYEDLKKAEKQIAELEKENESLKKQLIAIDTLDETNFEKRHNAIVFITEKQLKQFAEKVAKRLINIKGIKEILDETLKEFINEKE